MWQSNADLSKKLGKCASYVDYRLGKGLSYEEIIRVLSVLITLIREMMIQEAYQKYDIILGASYNRSNYVTCIAKSSMYN